MSPSPIALKRTSDYRELEPEYMALWDDLRVLAPERARPVLLRIAANQDRYVQAGLELDIPWRWVAIIHQMESDGRFDRHLHNGDPLTARTVHVPTGRPARGRPPFTWMASAVDALTLKNLDQERDWSIPRQLWHFESWNGWGYRRRNRPPSPYLWAGSNHERPGKFVADGTYDRTAVSRQVGAAVLLRMLLDQQDRFIKTTQGGA